MKIQESGENYLETILLLERKHGVVRSIDVANALGFSKPSVSRAMGVLKKAGYVDQEAYGDIHLTEAGRERAEAIYERHTLLTEYLRDVLGVDADIAEQDACRIEHIVSAQTIERMRSALKAHRKEN